MASRAKIDEVSNSAASAALIALIPIFLFIVTFGWQKIIAGFVLVSNYEIAQYLLAFVLAVVGVILARIVAAERIRIKYSPAAHSKYIWLAYFIVLLLISALGTMNSFFLFSQSQNVLMEAFSVTNDKLSALNDSIAREIGTPIHDRADEEISKKRSDLKSQFLQFRALAEKDVEVSVQANQSAIRSAQSAWDQFESEMRNSLRPGWGKESQKRFEELQTLVPEMKVLSGSEAAFGNNPAAAAKIEALLREHLKNFTSHVGRKKEEASISCVLSDATRSVYNAVQKTVPELRPLNSSKFECSRIGDLTKLLQQEAETAIAKMTAGPDPSETGKLAFKADAFDQINKTVAEINRYSADQNKVALDTARPLLEDAWRVYEKFYRQFSMLDPTAAKKFQPQIVMQDIRFIGQISNVMSLFLHRWDKLETYIILLLALSFDIILISFYVRHLHSNISDDDEQIHDPLSGSNSNGTTPRLL